jgi:hypothetical protein
VVLLFQQFWVERDKDKLAEVVERMRREGHVVDAALGQQLLHHLCAVGLWDLALGVLDDMSGVKAAAAAAPKRSSGQGSGSPAAAGSRAQDQQQEEDEEQELAGGEVVPEATSSKKGKKRSSKHNSSSSSKAASGQLQQQQQGYSWGPWTPEGGLAPLPASAAVDNSGIWRSRTHAAPRGARQTPAGPVYGVAADSLWHSVLRVLVGRGGASDEVVGRFVERMTPQQLLRFRSLYRGLRQREDGAWTVRPVQDWERAAGGSETGEEEEGEGAVAEGLAGQAHSEAAAAGATVASS